ncbi:hypothetical protein LTR64_005630 [Lithohypha guttulata]|uniref:uncharacterized protein n=1 Tax=Lithohypha guttulata TaxID=1690604 RepID=UPI002DE15895|nr:hypothetical protein LTR51_002576 [Lithohypha guttulata]
MSNPSKPNLYILYNAKASLAGKCDYVYRKLTSPADAPACSACDLTHGGLRLTETETWTKTKSRINANVVQLHIDELTPELKEFSKSASLVFPTVLEQEQGGELKVLLTAQELNKVSKDHEAFLSRLVESGRREGVAVSVAD